MRWTGLLACLLLLPACASTPEWDRSRTNMEGAYLEAAANYSAELFQPSYPFGNETNSKIGGGVRLGYRGSSDAAIELFADDNRGFKFDTVTGDDTQMEIRSLGVAGKFYCDHGWLQPYMVLGAGWAALKWDDHSFFDPVSGTSIDNPYDGPNDGFFLRGGLGCEFHFNETFGAFLEANYNFMTKHLRQFDHLDGVAGLIVRF